jgi:hypothetical protein
VSDDLSEARRILDEIRARAALDPFAYLTVPRDAVEACAPCFEGGVYEITEAAGSYVTMKGLPAKDRWVKR